MQRMAGQMVLGLFAAVALTLGGGAVTANAGVLQGVSTATFGSDCDDKDKDKCPAAGCDADKGDKDEASVSFSGCDGDKGDDDKAAISFGSSCGGDKGDKDENATQSFAVAPIAGCSCDKGDDDKA
jgi:hypothetical protein